MTATRGEDVAQPVDDLRIAGLVPFSTVDWPGKIAASVFLQGCPWKCPYCHNREILDPRVPGQIPWAQVEELLSKRRGLLDGLVFSGGEALMQASDHRGVSALEDALRRVHSLGFKTGLHTAGAYPERLRHLLDQGLLDWVGLDVKALPSEYEMVTGSPIASARVEASLESLVSHPEVDSEVRLTLWPPLGASSTSSTIRAEHMLQYAERVAKWSLVRGARNFALQRYRVPPGVRDEDYPGGDPGPNWDEEVALGRLQTLGFDTVSIR